VLLPALAASVRALGLPGRRVLVACSGGVDSSVLVHGLHALAGREALELAVGHVHHGLRGAEADADQAAARALAEKLGLPFAATRVDLAPLRAGRPSARRPTLQEAARHARYEALREQAGRVGADAIATAHTRDDQAETVLLRLFRGAGPDALGGIPERSPDGRIVRPLLGVGRDEVLDYARSAGLSWREDASNGSRRYARNRLRADWLPGLQAAFNPRLLRAVADLAEAERRDAEWLGAIVEAELARATREDGDAIWIDPAPWLAWPEALARRALRRLLQRVGAGRDVSRPHLIRTLRFLRAGRRGARLELPGGLRLARERDGFRLGPVGRRPPASC
jgi:tRNA(Ile)-lysidine synthase